MSAGVAYCRFMLERRAHPSRRFTLVELMVVVLIAAVLALVGLRAMYGHISASKSVEALTMVRSIQSAQARYRAVTGMYLDVSSQGTFYPRNPTGKAGLNR